MASELSIATINVRGLNNPLKRKTFLHWLESKHMQITCLQETFIQQEHIDSFTNDWNGKAFFSATNSPHSRGCAILLSNAMDIESINFVPDKEGRKLMINFMYCGQMYTIINIYAPNQ